MSEWGDRIARRMKEAGLNQTEMAAACGLKPPSVNDWLSGKTKMIDGMNLVLAAKALGATPEWIMTGRGGQSQSLTLTADKLGIALVAVERVARARGLIPEESWGTLAPLVLWAIALQDKHYPDGVPDLRGFDAQVLVELNGGNYGLAGDGKAAEGRVGEVIKAAAPRTKAGSRR